ncbi:Bicarbonate transport ATP-binding protein CmpC [bioreactor metagenome]|uniref:Bicarbonate transport ATP-binding protein CmpC n=2 Tax=root TaxID=1 RepID=A0A645J8C5_9ZZZZ
MDSSIWLFDEPFSALDPQMRGSLQALIMDLAKKERRRTVLFVTHNVDEAIMIGERILFMAKGRIYREAEVPFAYPRLKNEISRTPEYFSLASDLAELFYETGGERGAME